MKSVNDEIKKERKEGRKKERKKKERKNYISYFEAQALLVSFSLRLI